MSMMISLDLVTLMITFLVAMTLAFAWLLVRLRAQTMTTIHNRLIRLRQTLHPHDRYELSGPVITHRYWQDYVNHQGLGVAEHIGQLVIGTLIVVITGIFIPAKLTMIFLFVPFVNAVVFYIHLHNYDDLVNDWPNQVKTHLIIHDPHELNE
jgi:uncharacterized membrane protein